MFKNICCVLFMTLFFSTDGLIAQDLNQYKHVIVPAQYDFLNEANKYKLNAMTAFLLEKNGFLAIEEGGKIPEVIKKNPCKALSADVLSDSGAFSFVTKVVLVLKDCYGNVVFKSKEGRSRLKKYKFAYRQALRDAFSSLSALNHEYAEVVNETKQNNLPIEKKPQAAAQAVYVFNDAKYQLEKDKSGKGFLLNRIGEEKSRGHLYPTSKMNYIFRSEQLNGTAYFDTKGNLVVAYFDEKKGAITKRTYRLID